MQALSVTTTENWPTCLGLYRRRGDTLLTSAAARRRTFTHYDTNGTTWATTYTYDGDNRPTATTLANGKTVTNTYDALGRITRKRIGLSSNYDTTFTYLAGANNSQTALLASYQNGSDTAYTYTYDDNGNITRIQQGTLSAAYTYDAANQLIREDNGFINKTVTYTYDAWGNILTKSEYPYTTGTLGTPSDTVVYTYANSAWGDQLTSYDGETITYDAMGNPVSYRGYATSFEGKQLVSAVKTGQNITFAYDENGLRTQKTVNNVTTNYYYNGSVLISQVSGNDTLLFSYDASGSVVSVNFNGTDYYYVRNGQGDIVKLIDGNGTTVTEYTYDTWGKLVTCSGSLSATLGTLNPFRYRGYVYDTETGWYYLQSRYYDPEVGRFLSADVLLSTGQGVLGHNTYAYCLNNPVNMCDPSGCASKREMVDALLNSMIDPEIYHEVLSILSDINLKDSILCETILQGVTSSNKETATTVCYALTFLDDNIEYKLGPKDCSWFTRTVYSYTISGYPKGSMKQLEFAMDEDNNIKHGHPENWNLEFGDLLFFSSPCFCTTKCKRMFEIHHVGIYIGDGYFIDNSSNANISIRCLTPDLYTVDSNQVYVVYCARPVGGK